MVSVDHGRAQRDDITEQGVPIGDSYPNVRDSLRFITSEAFHQAAPTLAAKLSSIVDSVLWPGAERLWCMRSRADIVSLRVNNVISNVAWPYPANEIGHVGQSCQLSRALNKRSECGLLVCISRWLCRVIW